MNIPGQKRQATVVIRQPDPEPFGYEDGFVRLWTHADEPLALRFEEYGVRLQRPSRVGGGEVFVPWASIVRIDYGRCECGDCDRKRRALRHERPPTS